MGSNLGSLTSIKEMKRIDDYSLYLSFSQTYRILSIVTPAVNRVFSSRIRMFSSGKQEAKSNYRLQLMMVRVPIIS